MRKFIGGNGSDTTAAVMSWVAANKQLRMANLYLIGEVDDPAALWLTDYEAPLLWSWLGTFKTTVIKRSKVSCKVGLAAESLDLTWSPQNTVLTASIATANAYQLARMGYFDNKRVRIWRTIMPTPGDANTFGAMELFGGFIGDSNAQRGVVKFNVNSYLYLLNQKVPSAIIESTNTLAGYTGAVPPSGFTVCPQFAIVAGSSTNVLLADQTSPNLHGIPSTNSLSDGAVIFNGGAGATLQGAYSLIGANSNYDAGGGVHYTKIQLYSPLPWAPTPGSDTFYVTGVPPITGENDFPYVPSPQSAV